MKFVIKCSSCESRYNCRDKVKADAMSMSCGGAEKSDLLTHSVFYSLKLDKRQKIP